MDVQRERFLGYARGFFSGSPEVDPYIRLKVDHSLRVCANVHSLAEHEDALGEEPAARALNLAALYHDVGRFEQYRRFRTFSDAVSINHGALGVKIIREQGFFKDEKAETARLARIAVAAHNRFALPGRLRGRARLVLTALRDADKIDILGLIARELASADLKDKQVLMGLEDDNGACTPAIVRALEEGRTARYADMRYVNDFRALLCTWVHDLSFPSSLRAVKETGVFASIVAGLSGAPAVRNSAESLLMRVLGPDVFSVRERISPPPV
ncbi:MAG: HD domain-containing protein [Desulfovibrio sp.]|jgi:putative nucleotidyltransferase with HDIG domain|nr:HD domain-containing protein [Desulfovibrio sp.]